MEKTFDFLFFNVDNHRFAIPLDHIKKVLRVVEITEMPKMPKFLHGIINYFGKSLPILNLHFLFSVSPKTIELSDQLIVVRTPNVRYGLLVDQVLEVKTVSEHEINDAAPIKFGDHQVNGIIKQKDGLVLISDVDAFLSSEELQELEQLLDENKEILSSN